MTIKKFLIFVFFITLALPVKANVAYMNLDWWKNYNDEILNQHLLDLYENNHDLKIAAYKTKQAKENIILIGANQLPQASFTPEFVQTFKGSTHRFGDIEIPQYTQTNILLPIEASYEIDIWGQNYLNKKSAKKQKEIADEDERAAYIYITSSFVANYYNLIKTDELIKTTQNIVDIQSQVVNMTEKKYNNGLCSINELLNERQLLLESKNKLNKLVENKKILNNELLNLLGENTDQEVKHSDFESINYPNTPDSISALAIKNRPDLIKSEKYAQKVGIDVRVVKRDFLPKFILYGNIGFNAYNKGGIFNSNTFMSNVGILPRWDIFSGGAKLAKYRITKYEYKKSEEIYQKTVLDSIQELNNALVQTKTTKENLKISNEILSIEEQKYCNAQKKYNVGNLSKLNEMKEQINLLLIKQHHISAEIDDLISTITLYNAVGGVDYNNIDL